MEAIIRREKPDFVQVDYSMDNRDAEKRVIPAAAEAGAAVLTALPLGRTSLFRAVKGKTLPDWAKEFDAATWGQFFLKFLLGNPQVTAVIPGHRQCRAHDRQSRRRPRPPAGRAAAREDGGSAQRVTRGNIAMMPSDSSLRAKRSNPEAADWIASSLRSSQ